MSSIQYIQYEQYTEHTLCSAHHHYQITLEQGTKLQTWTLHLSILLLICVFLKDIECVKRHILLMLCNFANETTLL